MEAVWIPSGGAEIFGLPTGAGRPVARQGAGYSSYLRGPRVNRSPLAAAGPLYRWEGTGSTDARSSPFAAWSVLGPTHAQGAHSTAHLLLT